MRRLLILLITILSILNLNGQDCTIISKANNIVPDKLCSPVSVNWQVQYTGVNNAGRPVQIRYRWDDGTTQTVSATEISPGVFQTIANHIYTSAGNKCNYQPLATLVVNGVECTSTSQQQIVTVWDDDNHNGGEMHISPTVYPICIGSNANVRFQDLTQFNCVPPQERDVPNVFTRWIQWIYGTQITFTGDPVTINSNPVGFPYIGPVITLPGPVTGSGVYSDIINVTTSNYKDIGEYFQVTLRNWNYCNPYDDPNIPGPPADPINGDHRPVVTTAIILIVPYPDATIVPVDTLCITDSYVTLRAHDPGGIWSGPGVSGSRFYPDRAGAGTHLIRYTITDGNNCTDSDETYITVMPSPDAEIDPVPVMYVNAPPVTLTAVPPGGTWSGKGVSQAGIFNPSVAGIGKHVITYTTLPDRYGCSGIDTIHIRVIMPPSPEASFEPDTAGCSPLTVRFRNLSIGGESYLWDFGDKTYSTDIEPSHTYFIPGMYIVNLTVTNIAGKSSYHDTITVYQNPVAIFNVYPTEVINNSQIVTFYNYSQYGIKYLWDFGDGDTTSAENPWHKYEKEGVYNVILYVTSKDGCIDSASYTSPIVVEFKTGEIRFPNAFYWNKTGPTGGYWNENQIDDHVFRPFSKNVTEYKLQIFNRWGVLIYESDNLYKGWDGYFGNGNLAIQGVYVWKAKGKYADGTYFDLVGDVTFLH